MGRNGTTAAAAGGSGGNGFPDDPDGTGGGEAAGDVIRVFVVSSVRLVREGLVRGIGRRKGAVVAGCADLSSTQMALIADTQADVVVVDLATHEGLAAAGMLRSLAPGAKLVAFSVTEATESVLACAAAGFAGYVTREASIDDLLQAVADAAGGRLTCTPQMAAAMFKQLSQMLMQPAAVAPAPATSALTGREQQILALLNEGRSNKEIARQLQISPATVKNHIHNLLQKLKVERRAQAVAQMRG